MKFAAEYIKTSNNVENMRAKGKVSRISVERLCAGPAIPLLYAFMKKQHPELESVLEQTKHFDDVTAKDIINLGMTTEDPLCIMVMRKFLRIFGTAVGNYVLKTLPYGGVYLMGGVCMGMHDFIIKEYYLFMDAFHNKGRLSDLMRQFPVFLVHPSMNIGILGAEELARRILIKKI